MRGKVERDVGAFRVGSQERIEKLTEELIEEIYKITELELGRIYPEKNWYADNFAANLFSMALQICSQIQTGIVRRRAKEVTEMKG